METRTLLIACIVAACSPLTNQPGPSTAYVQHSPANACNVDPTSPLCDRDRDQVPDTRDACPDTAGPANGCPHPDADEDGVPDPSDKCQGIRETLNGFQDGDGCADEAPLHDPATTPLVLEELQAGRSKLDGRARLALDDYAIDARKAENIRFRISGHTDPSEAASEAARQQLGLRRAEAARDYLVQKWGVDPTRIEVRSAGDDEPVAHNGGAGGRAKNRRVEIVPAPR